MKEYSLYAHPLLTSFHQLLNLNVQKMAGGIAFRYRAGTQITSVTYAQFRDDIRALVSYFIRRGSTGQKIALIGENSYEWLLTYFAAVLSGNIIVPLDKELPDEEIAALLEQCGASFMIHSAAYGDTAKIMLREKHIGAALCMNEISVILESEEPLEAWPAVDETAVCAIIFTSGTTGRPKGVMLSQKALVADAVGACQNVYIEGPSMLTLPLHHTFAFTAGVLSMLLYHVPILISKSLRTFTSDMQSFGPQNMFLVPLYIETMYQGIWKAAKAQGKERFLKRMIAVSNFLRKLGIDLRRKLFRSVLENFGGNLTLLVSGGAAIRQEYIDGFDALGILVLNGYGITECAPVVAVNRNRSYKPDSIGLPLPCNEIRVINGELCVQGDNIMLGYYQNEEATAVAMAGGWFHTGDLGYIDKDGFVYITGRKKNLILFSNGKNVSPEELEEKLLGIPGVLEAVVRGEDGAITAEIFADQKAGIQERVMALNKELPGYKRIQKVKFRDREFEKTTTRKIKRGI